MEVQERNWESEGGGGKLWVSRGSGGKLWVSGGAGCKQEVIWNCTRQAVGICMCRREEGRGGGASGCDGVGISGKEGVTGDAAGKQWVPRGAGGMKCVSGRGGCKAVGNWNRVGISGKAGVQEASSGYQAVQEASIGHLER